MILTWIYRIIAAALAVHVGACMFTEEKWKKQVSCVLVLVPLILRALMIK